MLILIPANIITQSFGHAQRRLECQIKYPLIISGYLIWHSKRLRAWPNNWVLILAGIKIRIFIPFANDLEAKTLNKVAANINSFIQYTVANPFC